MKYSKINCKGNELVECQVIPMDQVGSHRPGWVAWTRLDLHGLGWVTWTRLPSGKTCYVESPLSKREGTLSTSSRRKGTLRGGCSSTECRKRGAPQPSCLPREFPPEGVSLGVLYTSDSRCSNVSGLGQQPRMTRRSVQGGGLLTGASF